MPAEWEPHEATWLGWPHEVTDWPGKFAVIPWACAEIVRHLSQVERVYLIVENRAAESRVRSMLKNSGANLGAVDFLRIPTDRGWMRDSGPICVRNESGEVACNNFVFNGWAKYANHEKDAASSPKPIKNGSAACGSLFTKAAAWSWKAVASMSTAAERCSPRKSVC